MDERERILKLVMEKKITVKEGLDLLNELNPIADGYPTNNEETVQEETVQEMIDHLVEKTVSDLQTVHEDEDSSDLDKIEKIAKDFGFVYSSTDGSCHNVSREELVKTAKSVVECAINNLLKRASVSDTPEDEEGMCGTGRFECNAWFEDNQIEVELKFVPFTAYSIGSECNVLPEVLLEKYKELHG